MALTFHQKICATSPRHLPPQSFFHDQGWRLLQCALEQALQTHGVPDVFNADQGSQFTSDNFIGALKARDIAISMDGRGRASDNIFVEQLWRSVKHEDVYLKGYATITDLMLGLTEYFTFYNTTRMHQSLGYNTPDKVYLTASGGGAKIIDKYSKTEKTSSEIVTKNRGSAVPLHE